MARKERAAKPRRRGILMPIIPKGDDEAEYFCDLCVGRIEPPFGLFCPVCQRIFCPNCEVENPMRTVKVSETGPRYKQSQVMCLQCEKLWQKLHPKQVNLDGYIQTQKR